MVLRYTEYIIYKPDDFFMNTRGMSATWNMLMHFTMYSQHKNINTIQSMIYTTKKTTYKLFTGSFNNWEKVYIS